MSAHNFWNDRYADDAFVYGTEPNHFLVEQHGLLHGPILSIAEGEGRNAVYLASLGLDVLGVDSASVGLAKAQRLAAARGVSIRTECADLATWEPVADSFGAVISIFAHLPRAVRARLYPRLEAALLPGGVLVLEAYHVRQLARATGGPRDAELLMTAEDVAREFPSLEPVLLREVRREVVEGTGHTGVAEVVQFVGRRPR
jgi:2-polyprenyl-3-methyl-5-hydroxy-6-metoxy-1,4-benzoquinol methylase